ncbi:hypothetical protein [Burkholderia metallica]|uniref:hypothetical protein n=1 Tax=Burkholderia metallica TaxID=488729 RepID=UPI001577347A|nr:hypothetical protein [Burkholderia metallica]NTZ10067.1 hypothetical protein [Burkholderia metallica]
MTPSGASHLFDANVGKPTADSINPPYINSRAPPTVRVRGIFIKNNRENPKAIALIKKRRIKIPHTYHVRCINYFDGAEN